MSLVTSRIGLIHRCSILRNEGHTDDWGEPTLSYDNHLTDIPCRAYSTAGREPVDGDRSVVFVDRRITVPLDTDVTETDMVGSVTYRGDTLMDGPMNIQAVLTYADHIELIVERVR